MFIKSFKTKSNVQLKSSDRKKLQSRIQLQFQLNDSDMSLLFPSKSTISQIKIITHCENIVTIYSSDKRPMFFEIMDGKLLPTVYTVWLVPSMLPTFTTHPNVLPRLANGADLMLPGVIKHGQGLRSYGNYKKNETVAVNLSSNKAAVGIGTLARSSEDLYMSGGVGICVKILHVFGDKLWSIDPAACLQIPFLGATIELPKDEDFPMLGSEKQTRINVARTTEWTTGITSIVATTTTTLNEKLILDEFPTLELSHRKDVKEVKDHTSNEHIQTENNVAGLSEKVHLNDQNEISPNTDIIEAHSEDDILKNAFLSCLKRDGKSLALPLLTSNFYRCHVLPAAEQPIDLKKTSYKKLSKFLNEMAANRFLTVKEENKGVEKITAINLMHPDLIDFVPKIQSKDMAGEKVRNNLFVTEMTELYLVTDETATFFARFNVANGDGIESGQIKKYLKEYVCNNKLQSPLNSRTIMLNDLLLTFYTVHSDDKTVSFDDLLATLLNKMTHSYEMRSKNELKTSKNATIQMTMATRSGNKKVTLINNLEAFGIRLDEFEKACRLGVAASTTITKLPHQKHDQLLVQGNQIRFVYKLLTETYKIPPKNIQGLELARKEKKSKK